MDILDISKYVYPDKTAAFEKLLKEHPEIIPDIAASTLRGVAPYLQGELLLKALRCCRNIILDMGYRETHLDEIKSHITNDDDRIIVIAGCQDEDFIDARANAAADLFKSIHMSARFIPVGKNPGRKKHQIGDESARIKTVLHRRLGRHLEIVDLKLEPESHRTTENIRNLFEGHFIYKNSSTTIFFVSSTFHLIPLAKEVNDQSATFMTQYPNVTNIFLIGSEDGVNKIVMKKKKEYVRALFYPLYDYILHRIRKTV